jgi:hypothetical protein
MTLDVSQVICSPQVAGVKVQHMGTFRRDAALLGGAVAGVGAGDIGARIAAGRSQAVSAGHRSSKRSGPTWRLRTRISSSSV